MRATLVRHQAVRLIQIHRRAARRIQTHCRAVRLIQTHCRAVRLLQTHRVAGWLAALRGRRLAAPVRGHPDVWEV
jgi:hypothetical protein